MEPARKADSLVAVNSKAEQQENGRAASAYFRASPVHDLHDMGETENHLPMKPLTFAQFTLLAATCASQNLVPNPSFEYHNGCPTDDGQMTLAVGWVDYLFSPDFWHTCGTPGIAGVPINLLSYQQPRTGAAYGGFHCYSSEIISSGGYREFMGIKLSTALTIGEAYDVRFFVSWSTAADGTQGSMQFANNNLGAYFRIGELFDLNWYPLPNYSHINSTEIVTDSIGWTLIEGSFVADSAYEYLYLGNFHGNQETVSLLLNPNGQYGYSYYYVDDVCVTPAGGDCLLLTTVEPIDESESMGLTVRVESGGTLLFITGIPGRVRLALFDLRGALVYEGESTESQFTLPLLASGTYVASFNVDDVRTFRQVVVLSSP